MTSIIIRRDWDRQTQREDNEETQKEHCHLQVKETGLRRRIINEGKRERGGGGGIDGNYQTERLINRWERGFVYFLFPTTMQDPVFPLQAK